MKAIEKLAHRLSTSIAFVAGAAMVLMMLQVSADVLLKYFANQPIPGTLEAVSSYYMAAMVFLPLGAVTRDGDHLEVELFTQGLSPRRLAMFQAFGALIGAIYVGVMLNEGIGKALHATRIGEVWETATWYMPIWPSRWCMPAGCALMFTYLLLQLADGIAFATRGVRLVPQRGAHAANAPAAAAD
ncbi:MAG: TRAP transporter small permease [Pseudomonadota bacterium]|nr:TRAP transporter small permease [Pseudomonadota bacterium]